MPERLLQQLSFIRRLEELKTVKRHNLTLDNQRPENSAEHSWHIAVMALLLEEHTIFSTIDILKVVKMLLIHDIAEIDVGDAHLYDEKARQAAQESEAQAMTKIVGLLPADQAGEFMSLWKEFEAGETIEARYANCLDALQPVINHLQTAPQGHNPDKIISEKVKEKKAFIEAISPALWETTLELIELSKEKGLYT